MPTIQPGPNISNQGQKHSWLADLQRLIFARTSLEAQLYPPLTAKVSFRVFEPRDSEACLAIYRKNEPGRFPPGHTDKFAQYLDRDPKTFIVAEYNSRVVGYGGINLLAPNIAVLCYGIVDPEFQGQRIGSSLVLLRIAQLPTTPDGAFFLIFAVDASMPIYQCFGFVEKARWKTEDGATHPLGLLRVPAPALDRIKSALVRRGLRIQGNPILHSGGRMSAEIHRTVSGSYRVQLRPNAGTENTYD